MNKAFQFKDFSVTTYHEANQYKMLKMTAQIK